MEPPTERTKNIPEPPTAEENARRMDRDMLILAALIAGLLVSSWWGAFHG